MSFCDEYDTHFYRMTETEKCGYMNEYLNNHYKCYCGALGIIYPQIKSQSNRDRLSEWWNNFVTSLSDSFNLGINEDCGINFQCDIITGNVTIEGSVTILAFQMSFPSNINPNNLITIVSNSLGVSKSFVTINNIQIPTRRRRQLLALSKADVKIEFQGNYTKNANNIKNALNSGDIVWIGENNNNITAIDVEYVTVFMGNQVLF